MAAAGGLAGLSYYLVVVSGKLTIDTGWGRRVRPLGPFGVQIAAPAATVFDVIAAPYRRPMRTRTDILSCRRLPVLGRITSITPVIVVWAVAFAAWRSSAPGTGCPAPTG